MERGTTQPRLQDVKIRDDFWTPLLDLVREVVIPYQKRVMEDRVDGVDSHAIRNFRIAAGLEEGAFHGLVFQDSDVSKWLEAASYTLATHPDPALDAEVDELVRVLELAQRPDGYLDTYFQLKEPERRWENLQECHELYCAGHLIEAAVAHHEATGKDSLLGVARRLADHIDARFGPGKVRGIPGHQEIELALLKLHAATGERRYRDLAAYFLDERGTEPNYFTEERKRRDWTYFDMDPQDRRYAQNHAPVREQDAAVGHAVRAMYMYAAMADLARSSGDEPLAAACRRLWGSVVERRMYVTGGIGSTVEGEAFTHDHDLPNDSMYCETCASVGLVFFARRMLDLAPSGRVADVMERALYNGVLAGMQLDGSHFFYVNPLEVVPGISGKQSGHRHVLPVRPEWYECACCPPNVARLLSSLGAYAWSERDGTVYSHLYVAGMARFRTTGGLLVETRTGYPWTGGVAYTIHPGTEGASFTLAIRIPGWSAGTQATLNGEPVDLSSAVRDGYLHLTQPWSDGDTVVLSLDLTPRRLYAHPAVRADADCVALLRGPLVHCLEQTDNGEELHRLRLPAHAPIRVAPFDALGVAGLRALEADGLRQRDTATLYGMEPPEETPARLRFVPYFIWGNRGEGGMRVWVHERR